MNLSGIRAYCSFLKAKYFTPHKWRAIVQPLLFLTFYKKTIIGLFVWVKQDRFCWTNLSDTCKNRKVDYSSR